MYQLLFYLTVFVFSTPSPFSAALASSVTGRGHNDVVFLQSSDDDDDDDNDDEGRDFQPNYQFIILLETFY